MKRHIFIVIIVLQCLNSHCQNVEYAVLEEYQGRKNRTPLSGIQIKAEGCNWTTTDLKGWFMFDFRSKNTKEVKDLEYVKDGYVIFNKDAVNQWRIANDANNRFHVVLCKQIDLINRIKEYYNIFDEELKKEIATQKKIINALNISLLEKEELIKEIEVEYNRRLNDIEIYAEKFARIDENEIIEEEYKALKLFRENRINEAIKVYDAFELGKKVDEKIYAIEDASNAEQRFRKTKVEQTEDLRRYIPMLSQQIEWMKLGGQRNEDSLIVNLNRIIKAYHIVSDTTYNKSLAISLYDLGCIHEPIVINYISSLLDGGNINDMEARHENPVIAEKCFKEASELGYAPAQYHLGRLYECSISGLHDLLRAKKNYSQAAEKGYLPAIYRMDDFFDFGERDNKGNMIYYHILSQNKKRGTVKVTYLDQSYATYGESVEKVPSQVIHKGIKYDVKEIGRNAFRLSKVKRLIIPEGVEKIEYYAFRSTHDINEIYLPKSLRYINPNTQSWACSLKKIYLDNQNNSFYLDEIGHLHSRVDNSVILYLDTLKAYDSWSEKSAFSWAETDGIPAKVTSTDINKDNGFYGCEFPSVTIPDEIDTIPDKSFYFTKLKTLTIPENVKEIGNRAFMASNELIDVLLPSKLQGLRSESFCSCEMMSDVYMFTDNVPPADVNTFSEGRAFRYLHVPKGSRTKYSESQGWSMFNHIAEDLEPLNPLYNALLLRSHGRYKDAIASIDSVISHHNHSTILRAKSYCLKSLLYYQIGDEDRALESAKKAISDNIVLESLSDTIQLDLILNINVSMATLLLDDDKSSLFGLRAFVDSYKKAVVDKRYEIMETAEQTWFYIQRWMQKGKKQLNEHILKASTMCSELLNLFVKSHNLQVESPFIKSEQIDFASSAKALYEVSSEIALRQSEIMRNEIDQGTRIDTNLIINCMNYTMLNQDNHLEDVINCAKEITKLLHSDDFEKNRINGVKTLNNLAYVIYKTDKESVLANTLIENLYEWTIHNPSNAVADSILLDICSYTNKMMPPDYTILSDFILNIENGIIPDSIKTNLSDYYLNEGSKAYQEENYKKAMKYYILAGYSNALSLRMLGIMCFYGEGLAVNNELAIRLFKQAINKGDKDVSYFLLGIVYQSEYNYQCAFESFSNSTLPTAQIYIANMYELGNYVDLDLSKAVSIYQALINNEIVGEKAQKSLERVASKLNSMAYEEVYADNYSKAEEYINFAISLVPTSGDYIDSKGEIYLWKGDIDEALFLWNKAYEMQPDVIERSALYWKLIELGKIEEQ